MIIRKSLRLPVPGSENQTEQAKVTRTLFKIVGVLALLVIALLFPLQISPDTASTGIAIFTLMFAAWTTSWNIFSGYSGYIALGHAAFFGTGAYALGVMCQRWHLGGRDVSLLIWHIPADYVPFLFVPLAGLIAGVAAIPLGWVALQTRRHTFIVITIAIFFVFQLLAENNLLNFTNGTKGLEFPVPTWTYPFYNFPFYYAMLTILLLALAISWWVRHSKYGLGLLAIRDDEDRALGLGVKTGPSKLVAFVISALFVGMLGAVWGYFQYSISPQFAFDPLDDIAVALMGFLGGMGTLAGPVLGALILEPAQQYFALYFGASGYYLIIYGTLFLVIILLLPQGIVPTLSKWWSQWRAKRINTESIPGDADTQDQSAPVAVEQAGTGEEVNL